MDPGEGPSHSRGQKNLPKKTSDEKTGHKVLENEVEVIEKQKALGNDRESRSKDIEIVEMGIEDFKIEGRETLYQVLQDYTHDKDLRMVEKEQDQSSKQEGQEKGQESQPTDEWISIPTHSNSWRRMSLSREDLELLQEVDQSLAQSMSKSSKYKLKAESLLSLAHQVQEYEKIWQQPDDPRAAFQLLPVLKKHLNLLTSELARGSLRQSPDISLPGDQMDHKGKEGASKGHSHRPSSSKSSKASPTGTKDSSSPKTSLDHGHAKEPSTSKEKRGKVDEDEDEEDPPVYKDTAFSLESQLKQHENLLSFQTANRSRRPTLISLPEDQIDHNVNSKKESWQGQSSGKSSKGSLPDSRDSLKLMSYLDPESDKEPSTLEEEAEKKVDEDMDEDDLDLPMYQDTSFYLLPLLKKHENLLSFQTANRSRRPTLVISFTEDERDHTDHHDTGKRQQSRRSSVKSLKGSQPGSKELHWPKPISYFDPRPTNEPSTSKEKEKERVEENEDQDEDQDEEDPPVYRDTDSKMFAKSILKSHNDYRQKHGCPPIKICQKLNHDAQQYADALATTKVLKHSSESSRGNCGENLSWASYDQPGHEVADRWYSEIRNYDYKSPGFTPESGHFTAMIWKGTKKMGVGKASANDGSSYVVARYFPAGNIVNPGLFEENVPRPKT